MLIIVAVAIFIVLVVCISIVIINDVYKKLETEVLGELGFSNWNIVPYYDTFLTVKSRQALNNYTSVKFFKEDRERLERVERILKMKKEIGKTLNNFLKENNFKSRALYGRLETKIRELVTNTRSYRISITYISSAGNNLGERMISVTQHDINEFRNDPSLLMSKGEYSKYLKEQYKIALDQKHHDYYDRVNTIIDFANENRDSLVIKGSLERLDGLVDRLYERTVNNIKKIKTIESEEWDIIGDFIDRIETEIKVEVEKNKRILEYYQSSNFLKIKETCKALMDSQREFNEYISEKVESISHLFGARVIREETTNEDEYEYIRPYKKSISPFTAEVSAAVFASAENNPLEYLIKNFYPNKAAYPEQIQKLHLLVEELETLKDAKRIIENYKLEYQQYLSDVPDYVMESDESGFYSRLGFANIDESALTIEYKFSYTSGGGKAKRCFPVPMTEETIVELIKALENKLTTSAFTKEQRALMTSKLREFIKTRDEFTCCRCGNSIHKEPNLLLEIDHIIPVSKGGYTVEENLQTLCWKCNRAKSNKI